jgi:transcriptional regulator with XRE-family HTH domain
MPIAKEVGLRLKAFRVENDIPVEDLSAALGIKRQSFYNFEIGRTKVSIDHMKVLHEVFGLDITWLITGKKAEPTASAQALEEALREITEQSAHMRKQGDLIMEKFRKEI